MLFSRPALRMVLNGAPAVDWTVVQPRLSPAGCKGLQRFSEAGIQFYRASFWTPAFAGVSGVWFKRPSAITDSLVKQPIQEGKRHRPYSLSRPRAGPSSLRLSSPPDTRGWRARGRCRRQFKIRISLRKCGSASRRATRTSLKCPGSFAAVFFRFAHSRKRNACAGPRFPGRRPDRGFPPIRGCREYPPGLPSLSDGLSGKKLRASLNGCTVSQLLAGGSYWPPGGAPAPPECVGGAFVSRPRAPHPAPSSDAS